MSPKESLVIGLFAALALGLYLTSTPDNPGNSADSERPRVADYVATDLIHQRFDETGRLQSTLQAEQANGYQSLNLIRFAHPRLEWRTQDDWGPWQLQANTGYLYDNELLELDGAVQLTTHSPQSPVQQATTDFLTVDLEAQTVDTTATVEATGPGLALKGTGLRGRFADQQLTLLQQVTAVYERP